MPGAHRHDSCPRRRPAAPSLVRPPAGRGSGCARCHAPPASPLPAFAARLHAIAHTPSTPRTNLCPTAMRAPRRCRSEWPAPSLGTGRLSTACSHVCFEFASRDMACLPCLGQAEHARAGAGAGAAAAAVPACSAQAPSAWPGPGCLTGALAAPPPPLPLHLPGRRQPAAGAGPASSGTGPPLCHVAPPAGAVFLAEAPRLARQVRLHGAGQQGGGQRAGAAGGSAWTPRRRRAALLSPAAWHCRPGRPVVHPRPAAAHVGVELRPAQLAAAAGRAAVLAQYRPGVVPGAGDLVQVGNLLALVFQCEA